MEHVTCSEVWGLRSSSSVLPTLWPVWVWFVILLSIWIDTMSSLWFDSCVQGAQRRVSVSQFFNGKLAHASFFSVVHWRVYLPGGLPPFDAAIWFWNFVIASVREGESINWLPTTPCSPLGDVSCKRPLAPQRGHGSSPRPVFPQRHSSYTAPTCNWDQRQRDAWHAKAKGALQDSHAGWEPGCVSRLGNLADQEGLPAPLRPWVLPQPFPLFS